MLWIKLGKGKKAKWKVRQEWWTAVDERTKSFCVHLKKKKAHPVCDVGWVP